MVDITGTVDQTVFYTAIILTIIAVGLILWFIWFRLQFKHVIIVRDLYNKRKVIITDKFRVYNDKNTGVKWYQLLKLKDKIPVAPKEAIEVGKKGNMFVEAYRTPTGEYIYLKDDARDIIQFERNDNFKPLTTSQRVIQFHLFEGKMKHKRKTWKDLIIPIVGIIALTMIVISLMVFWGDLAKPVLEQGKTNAKITQQQTEITQILKEIIQKEQLIKDDNTKPTETPPN